MHTSREPLLAPKQWTQNKSSLKQRNLSLNFFTPFSQQYISTGMTHLRLSRFRRRVVRRGLRRIRVFHYSSSSFLPRSRALSTSLCDFFSEEREAEAIVLVTYSRFHQLFANLPCSSPLRSPSSPELIFPSLSLTPLLKVRFSANLETKDAFWNIIRLIGR